MRNTLSILLFFLFISFLPAQNVTIPDTNFLNALINAGVDTSGDGVIQTSEALAISQLSIGSLSISNLAGIEAFTNLTSLYCPINNLSSIDVSKNTLLQNFDIGGNYSLTALNLSKNTALQNLDIIFTGLTTIDLSNNLQLVSLACNGTIYSGFTLNNRLTSLDVSKNLLLTSLSADMNPQLNSICVNPDQLLNRVANWSKDPACNWDTTCTHPIPSPPPVVNTLTVTPTPTSPSTDTIPVVSPVVDLTTMILNSYVDDNNQKTKPKIIRSFDMLGNEIDVTNTPYQGIIIYQYSDGTTRKVLKME